MGGQQKAVTLGIAVTPHHVHCPLKVEEQESLEWEFRGTSGEALLCAWQYFSGGERNTVPKGKGRNGVVRVVGCRGQSTLWDADGRAHFRFSL